MSSKPKTSNDKAWEKLFHKYAIETQIEKNGYFEISSVMINEFREARLMTKFDYTSNLPQLFEKNNLSILPITRGSYIISDFNTYETIPKPATDIVKVNFPEYICSIDYENITSESTAINCAYVSGILNDFLKEERLMPTINGRMSSGEFNFNITKKNNITASLRVSNSQIEIDGGYEGINSLSLIEAKNSISDDFLIRQLYYPYRLWNNKIGNHKSIRPIFMTYSNGIFTLNEYVFEDPQNYNSLVLVQQKNYSIEPEDIVFDDIHNIYNNVKLNPEPIGIPFPQANSFKRVINICELLFHEEKLTTDDITYKYDFDSRQTNYYTDACRYLGLVDKVREDGTVKYFLTTKGKKLFGLNIKKRNLEYVKLILSQKTFYLTFGSYLNNLETPNKDEIVAHMLKANLYNINSLSTFERRASTISGWINWILDLAR